MTTALYAAICSLFLIFLSIRVIRLRRDHRVSVGHQQDPDLERAMRVQANFCEYTPFALVLLLLAELQGLPAWGVHGGGILLIVARGLHFAGFRSAEAPGRFRVLGMVLTFAVLGLLSAVVALLWLLSLSGFA